MHAAQAADRSLGLPPVISDSPAQTRALGRGLGRAAFPGAVVALIGPLGAGKTQLAKGIAEGLGVTGVVNSPTFIIVNEHVGRMPLFHVDAYRIDDAEEALQAGIFDERHAQGVTVIEWADRLGESLPLDRLVVSLQPDPILHNRRSVRWQADGSRHATLASALAAWTGVQSQ